MERLFFHQDSCVSEAHFTGISTLTTYMSFFIFVSSLISPISSTIHELIGATNGLEGKDFLDLELDILSFMKLMMIAFVYLLFTI